MARLDLKRSERGRYDLDMKTHSTQFKATAGTDWKVKVTVHPSQKNLNRAYGPNQNLKDNEYVIAFCENGEGEYCAGLHFTRKNFSAEIMAHEALHAAFALSAKMKLRHNYEPAEELLAETVENIVRECLIFKYRLKLK